MHKSTSDDDIHIDGFLLIRRDIPDDTTHGGVLIYYRDNLAVRERTELQTFSNMLVCEILINNKKIILSVTYRQHHDSSVELETFMPKYREMCNLVTSDNPLCALHIGDLNCRSSEFWRGDIDNDAGNNLVTVLNDTGLHQLVHEPTHFVNDSRSCLDLVITDQPNLINECSMLPSLHITSHHSINHIVLNINNPPPPAYKRKMWHYDRAQTEHIINSIKQFDWKQELGVLANDPNLQVKLLTDVLINIFTNFIPNDEKVVRPREPAWMTNNITHSYRKYKKAYKSFVNSGCPSASNDHIEFLKQEHTNLVTTAQEKYLISQGNKLSNSGTNIQQV